MGKRSGGRRSTQATRTRALLELGITRPPTGRFCPRCGQRVYLVTDQRGRTFLIGTYTGRGCWR